MDRPMANKITPSRGLRVRDRSGDRKILARDERGQALLEFALVLVVLVLILLGIITFGIAFNNQITLTNAVNNAAQALMSSKGAVNSPKLRRASTTLTFTGVIPFPFRFRLIPIRPPRTLLGLTM